MRRNTEIGDGKTGTLAGWECLCIDDGSTDGSGAILDEYARKDARFRVHKRQMRGMRQAYPQVARRGVNLFFSSYTTP